MALLFKSRTQDVQGKSRLYFCSTPEDLTFYLAPLCEDILQIQNCGIWYPGPDTDRSSSDHLQDLTEMQLFILPVSSQLLYGDNGPVQRELALAKEHHIPILPVLMEDGLADDFNQQYEHLQALDRCSHDDTAISYQEKLKTTLSSILIGDELAAKVRAAFDAYVFLSYRKKDRRHAKEVMQLIHKNEFCRDLAIWYDEFLAPGENFNHAIESALQKSGMFVLTVTPNLVDDNNYIIRQEYPMAMAKHKPIVPVELVATDKTLLSRYFQDLPPCTDAHDEMQLSSALMHALEGIAVRENDSDPQHNFFIGLAYLSGIDVEVDHARALQLITGAAEAGLVEAMDQLVRMYRTGTGVPRDAELSLSWLERKITILESRHDAEQSDDSFDVLTDTLSDCGYNYQETNAPWRCKEKYDRILALSAQGNFSSAKHCQATALCSLAGYAQRYDVDRSAARNLYHQSITVGQELVTQENTAKARRVLAYSYLMLGTLYREEANSQEAMFHLSQSEALYDQLYQEYREHEDKQALLVVWDYLCLLYLYQPDHWNKAMDYAQKSLQFSQQELDENPNDIARSNLATSYFRLGQVLQKDPNTRRLWDHFDQVIQAYETAYDLTRELADKNPTIRHRRDLSMCCRVLAQALSEHNQRYPSLCREAIDLLETCLQDSPTIRSKKQLAHAYQWTRAVLGEKGLLRSIQLHEELVQEGADPSFQRALATSYELLADRYRIQTNDPDDPWSSLPYEQASQTYDTILSYYQKSIDIWKALSEDPDNKEDFASLMTRYKILGNIYLQAGWTEKAEALRQLREDAWEARYPTPKAKAEDVKLDLSDIELDLSDIKLDLSDL